MTDGAKRPMDPELEARAEALRKAGHHSEAASLYADAGLLERAAALHAEVWQWDEALALTAEAGRWDEHYRFALSARREAAVLQALEELPDHPEQAEAAAYLAEKKGRPGDAAALWEGLGEPERAAKQYNEAQRFGDAARCEEVLGRIREAGKLYEKQHRHDPGDHAAALSFARILARFGRYDVSAKVLQGIGPDSEHHNEALAFLVGTLAAQGWEDAAEHSLSRLREREEGLPRDVEVFLEQRFGDRRGLVAKRDGGEELLGGRYFLERNVGAGASGRVVKARDLLFERPVAVKLLHVSENASGRDALRRFAREAQVARALEHPNVVRTFEYNAAGPYLVLEWMGGGTLEGRLAQQPGPWSPAVVRGLVDSLLSGLEVVHRRGLVHRDLKPANIFFSTSGTVKIGDFGVAHLQDLGATLTGAMIGTLAYMSPEQISGSQAPTAASDFYALGVLMFQLLTGRLPFPGPDYLAQHLNSPVPTLASVHPGLDASLEAVVAALLAKEPSERPPDATAVRRLIREAVWEDIEVSGAVAPVPEQTVKEIEERWLEQGGQLRDRWLERSVLRRGLGGDGQWTREQCQQAARADGPFLQGIWSIDEQEAILEMPQGVPWEQVQGPKRQEALETYRDEIIGALGALHEAGLSHGSIDAAHLCLGPGRLVLLLPEVFSGTPDGDVKALEALLR